MGFEILPWNDGDEDHFEVFTITSDARWTPRRYLENEQDPHRMKPNDIFVMTQDTEPFQDANQVDLTDSNQDLLSQVSPTILQDPNSFLKI